MKSLVGIVLGSLVTGSAGGAVVDAFEDVRQWIAAPSDEVHLTITSDQGVEGRAMRLDFDFGGGAGYAIARRPTPMQLPDDYELSFFIRGDAPPNTLEIKLLDPSGESVWWVNRRHMSFPSEWTRVRLKKRHFEFAWGPSEGAPLTEISAIEIVVTASTGGKGTVWVDELRLDPLEPRSETYPAVRASATAGNAANAVDEDPNTSWRVARLPAALTLDFGVRREMGGVTLSWNEGAHATDYDILTSDDGDRWFTAVRIRGSRGGSDTLFMPDTDTRYMRLDVIGASGEGVRLREIAIEPLAISESRNRFFSALASRRPRGLSPRYLHDEQSYWTVVGDVDAEREALLNTDGALEVDAASFMIEPFLFSGGRLITWKDVVSATSLEEGYLPIPSVRWEAADDHPELTITAFAEAERIYARYRVVNRGAAPLHTSLFLALRPFQVNPPWQFLNIPGGAARIERIAWNGESATAQDHVVRPLTVPDGFGATTSSSGDIVELLEEGELPQDRDIEDATGYASAAFRFDLPLAAGESRDVWIAIPDSSSSGDLTASSAAALLERVGAAWRSRLSRFHLQLPDSASRIADVIRSNAAYILINQDHGAIQPGSRAYDRSWIRDGSLTSAALLRLGYSEPVREFIEWFAPYQFASGKVPCCVDLRGADPVPEHDSSGQFIYLLAEYYRHTGDLATLQKHWPEVQKAVRWIESLIAERTTDEYRSAEKRPFYGLVPESISHEGYSAKPMHSYWDDFFVLKGLSDAVEVARLLDEPEAQRYARVRDTFRENLHASIVATRRMHRINFIPGSVELGDFDATSTTIALDPVNEATRIDERALRATFDRYWNESLARMESDSWEAYTPYETRAIGTFVRLGERERAHTLMNWLMKDIRPREWNHWAEVVFRDPATPKFIGDMPHTWVGSDFIRSVLDMFAYTQGETLVLAHGVPDEWTQGDGLQMRGLRTHHGIVDLSMKRKGDRLHIDIGGSARPPGGVFLRPDVTEHAAATVNGVATPIVAGAIEIPTVPALVVIE